MTETSPGSVPATPAAPAAPLGPPVPTTVNITTYLVALRALLDAATDSRRSWVRQVGIAIGDAQLGKPAWADAAIKVGEAQHAEFDDFRTKVAALNPPTRCDELHKAVVSWLDKQMIACSLLIDVGHQLKPERFREVQSLLAEGRADTDHYTAEYTRLVAELRQISDAKRNRVKTKKSRFGLHWPTRKPQPPSPAPPHTPA